MWWNGRPWLRVAMVMMAMSLLAPVAVSCSSPGVEAVAKPPAPLVGRMAPDFSLRDLNGNAVQLSDFRGKVVMLNFFATW